jgi:hypothetical protein
LLIINDLAILCALVLASLLCLSQQSQFVIPVRLQGIGHEAVIRIYANVATPGQFSVIARPLDLLLPESVGFIQPALQLLLDGQRDFDRNRRNRFDEDVPDFLINRSSWNMLADRFGVFDALPLTHIVWNQPASATVIAYRHALAATAADQ